MSEPTNKNLPGRCPISFDQHTSEHAQNWPEKFRKMREECPRVRSDLYGGFWVVTKYNDIVSIAQHEKVGSKKVFDPGTGKAEGGIAIPVFPVEPAKPSETDSPEWDGLRGFLNGRFAPKVAEQFRPRAKELAAALVDEFIEKGQCDIVDDLTNPLPSLVTMTFLGFPLDEWKIYADALHKQTYLPQTDPAFLEAVQGMEHFRNRVAEEIEKRRAQPSDDMLSYLAHGQINGKPLDIELIKNMAVNILLGGVDTTTALTSNALYYLSQHQDQRQKLIDDLDLLPRACEEFLRYFTPLHALARTANEDLSIGDWQLEKSDRILLAYASGNRDPEIFENPEEVILDRTPNRHIAFGSGKHRCLGSFLARIMFQAMMTEVLTRLPDYSVTESECQRYPKIGYVNGWINMPVTFTPGKRVGSAIV